MTRVFKLVALGVAFSVAALLGGLGVLVYTSNQIDKTVMTAENNARVLELLAAMTGCRATDTVDECSARVKTSGTAEGARRIGEVDCVTRRAIADLPAPVPPDTCISQTPAEVYPGLPRRTP